jgi:hypothetical protein
MEAAMTAPETQALAAIYAEQKKARKLFEENTPQKDAYAHKYWGGFCDAMAFVIPLVDAAVQAAGEEMREALINGVATVLIIPAEEGGVSSGLDSDDIRVILDKIRALPIPDASALERATLEARIDEAKVWHRRLRELGETYGFFVREHPGRIIEYEQRLAAAKERGK